MQETSLVDITPSINLVPSLRTASHDFRTAIADLIDNSIDAECESVWIRAGSSGGKTHLIIADNGDGMDLETLVNALRYGWHNPENSGLGKFGLGMKTSATSLGEKFTILSRSEPQKLLKAVFDPSIIMQQKAWKAPVGYTTEQADLEQMKEFLNENETGTIILIENLSQFNSPSNLSHGLLGVRKHLGRVFRYFLTPNHQKDSKTGKLRMFVNETEIFGVDPLESQASHTTMWFDDDIDLGDGNFVRAKCAYLSDLDAGINKDGDSGELNYYLEKQTYQGVYVVRENREIMAADTTVFEPIWGGRHPSKNYLRIELRYSKLDHVFKVDHDKSVIKDVGQSAMDILREKLSLFVTQCARVRRAETASRQPEDLKKTHENVEKEILSKTNLLDVPKSKKIQRIKSGEKTGTVHPKNTPARKNGKSEILSSRAGNFKIGFCNLGSSGQLFQLAWEKNVIQIDWNTSHPFYQKFMLAAVKDQISSIDYMTFALAAHLTKTIQQDPENGWGHADNFIASVSNNLRVLAM